MLQRGLEPGALEALAELAKDSDSWWRHLLDLWTPSGVSVGARPLRLAVRDGYLNFYLKGQSVSRVAFDRAGTPFAEVHVKYVFEGASDQSYVRLTGKSIAKSKGGRAKDYAGASMLRDWMARAALWETPEKIGVERVVADNPTVIDLEMGLPAGGARKTARRMDLVILERHETHVRIVFWEAKRITDARLRSMSPEPEVMDQIKGYKAYLHEPKNCTAVIDAYRHTCETLVALTKMAGRDCVKQLDPLIAAVADGKSRLEIDRAPRLVIFGKSAEIEASSWKRHEKKLADLGVTMSLIPSDIYRLA